jgi:hypothetical protein
VRCRDWGWESTNRSVWYRFQPPHEGTYTFDASGSDFPATIHRRGRQRGIAAPCNRPYYDEPTGHSAVQTHANSSDLPFYIYVARARGEATSATPLSSGSSRAHCCSTHRPPPFRATPTSASNRRATSASGRATLPPASTTCGCATTGGWQAGAPVPIRLPKATGPFPPLPGARQKPRGRRERLQRLGAVTLT